LQEYVDNHITTARYLGGFTDPTGSLEVRRVHAGDRPVLARPRAVAFRKYFWGYSPGLRKEIEQRLSDLEAEVAPGLATLPERWPLLFPDESRLNLALFVAVHLLRTPGWKQLVPMLGDRLIDENETRLVDRFRMTASEMSAVAQSDAWRATVFADQLPLLGRMLAAMHWTLVSFREPVLITGDQPVVAIPCDQSGADQSVAPLPAAGLLHTLEFRFATDPRHLLLLTWAPEQTDGVISGTPWVAATANCAVRAQADAEWFSYPGANPLFLAPPFLPAPTPWEPISPSLIPGYSVDRALRSPRRGFVEHRVHQELDQRLSEDLREAFPRSAA
jgi:hypothetical protein